MKPLTILPDKEMLLEDLVEATMRVRPIFDGILEYIPDPDCPPCFRPILQDKPNTEAQNG